MVAFNWQNREACVNPMMLTRTFIVPVKVYLDYFV